MSHQPSSNILHNVVCHHVCIFRLTIAGRLKYSLCVRTSLYYLTTTITTFAMALNNGKYVMLSYSRKNQKIVEKVHDILKLANIPIWFDRDGAMKDNLYQSMAEGVENAAAVCCFISPEYQESEYCQLELTYAEEQRKRIIVCIVADKQHWKPSSWLGLITSRLLHINFEADDSKENIELKTKELIERIGAHPAFVESSHEPNHQKGVDVGVGQDVAVVCDGDVGDCTKYSETYTYTHYHHHRHHHHHHHHHASDS